MATSGLVFISAARDDFAHARRVFTFLTEHGVDVFLAGQAIAPGDDAEATIEAKLDAAVLLVVIASSIEGLDAAWLRRERLTFQRKILVGRKSGNVIVLSVGAFSQSDLPPDLRESRPMPLSDASLKLLLECVIAEPQRDACAAPTRAAPEFPPPSPMPPAPREFAPAAAPSPGRTRSPIAWLRHVVSCVAPRALTQWFDREAGRSLKVNVSTSNVQLDRNLKITGSPSKELLASALANSVRRGRSVDCTVFSPQEVARDSQLLVQVFVHAPEKADEAASTAKEFDEDAVRRGHTRLDVRVRPGELLTFEMTASGVTVDERVRPLRYDGRTASVQFVLGIPRDFVGERLVATLTVSHGEDRVPVGHIAFQVRVGASTSPVAAEIGLARRYAYAFLSYSSADLSEVTRRAQMLRAMEIDFYFAKFTNVPGDDWERRYLAEIGKADLFLLFWSETARKSEHVRREYLAALKRKQDGADERPAIKPVILEGPPVPEWPDELQSMHFDDALVFYLGPPVRAG